MSGFNTQNRLIADVDELEEEGASSTGAPCWFEDDDSGGAVQLPPSTNTRVPFRAMTDGVAAGTDIVLADGDATSLEVVTAGTYMVGWTAIVQRAAGADPGWIGNELQLNDDDVGPAYYANVIQVLRTGGFQYLIHPTIPLVLAEGDVLGVPLNPAPADCFVGNVQLQAIRIG